MDENKLNSLMLTAHKVITEDLCYVNAGIATIIIPSLNNIRTVEMCSLINLTM